MALLSKRPAVRAWIGCFRFVAVAIATQAALFASATPVPEREYQVKAVFLYNFAQFVDWPAEAFSSDTSPLIIGVLGQDPFGVMLDDAVRGESVHHRPIEVRRFRRVEDVDRCHVLFISRSEQPSLAGIIRQLDHRSILTVSDADGFNRDGGMIRLVTENNRLRLRIDPGLARAAGLVISSKLLRPAEIVATGERRS